MGIASFIWGGAKTAATVFILAIVPGLLLWGAVNLFDVALNYTVFDFANTINFNENGTLISAVKNIWLMTRDMANILIIGSFVYISIAKILSLNKDFRRLIISLITVAILINFSFFFTLVAVDTTNWASVQIYNAMLPEVSAPNETLGEIIVTNMNGVQMTAGFTKVFDTIAKGFSKAQDYTDGLLSQVVYFILTLVLTLVAALMFFRMAFILITRFVLIFIFLATSSLAFAAMLIPAFNKYWVAWRNGLLYNSIVAPLLLLMLYIVTIIMKPLYEGSVISENSQLDDSFVKTIIIFFIGIGLLWGAIRISTIISNRAVNSLGGLGSRINGLMNWTQGLAGRGLFASAGWAGRNSFGRLGTQLQGGLSSMADRAPYQPLRRGIRSLANSTALNKVANNSYDGRQSKATQKFMEQAGMSVGSGIKESFKKIEEAKAKKDMEYAQNKIAGEQQAKELAQEARDSAARDAQASKTAVENKKREREAIVSEKTQAQTEKTTATERKEAVEKDIKEIEQRIQASSNTAEASRVTINSETAEINKIQQEISVANEELANLIQQNMRNPGSKEREIAKTRNRLSTLQQQQAERQEKIQEHTEIVNSHNLQLSELAKLETEKAELEVAIENTEGKEKELDKKLQEINIDIQKLTAQRDVDAHNVKSYNTMLDNMRSKWKEAILKTRAMQQAPPLSDKEILELEKRGITIDNKGNVSGYPSEAVLRSMSSKQRRKMNALLTKLATHKKEFQKYSQGARMTAKERAKAEQTNKVMESLANIIENTSNSANNNNNSNNENTKSQTNSNDSNNS